MLEITVPAREDWDEVNECFVETGKEQILRLEHSLVSLSKWESKWCKPFLSTTLTDVETIDYVRCMTITQNVPPETYERLTGQNIRDITEYINAPMTATTFVEREQKGRLNREVITAEIIYYWMIAHGIPSRFEKWHLNRLLTLVRVCNLKSTPSKKMSQAEIMRQNAALNAARRKQYNSRG